MKDKVYRITKEECQKQIDELGNVCDRCGRNLVPIETVDNSNAPTFWEGCMHGEKYGHYTSGVKKEIYEIAKKMVLDGNQNYSSVDFLRKKDWFMENVSYFCGILRTAEYYKNHEPEHTYETLHFKGL
jgi:hypothetical protein